MHFDDERFHSNTWLEILSWCGQEDTKDKKWTQTGGENLFIILSIVKN